MGNNLERMKIPWHPGFYGAMEIELITDKQVFVFQREYKSPDDGLTIDDYYKTIGYACLYKAQGETVNQIPADKLTASIFHDRYPRELFRELMGEGLMVEEAFPGIYYAKGKVLFDTQIVVTSRLKGDSHKSLCLLFTNVQKKDAREFIRETEIIWKPFCR